MTFLRSLIFRRRYQCRIVWMLLGLLTLALIGFPTQPRRPDAVASGDGEAFPCQQHACGCASAEFCWDRCCCYSDSEKLAWAEAHDVEPPEFLRRRVAHSAPGGDEMPRSCCSHGSCDTDKTQATDSGDTEPSRSDADSIKSSLALAWKAAQCGGTRSLWTLLSCALVPKEPPALAGAPIVMERLVLCDDHAQARAERPDPPIP